MSQWETFALINLRHCILQMAPRTLLQPPTLVSRTLASVSRSPVGGGRVLLPSANIHPHYPDLHTADGPAHYAAASDAGQRAAGLSVVPAGAELGCIIRMLIDYLFWMLMHTACKVFLFVSRLLCFS